MADESGVARGANEAVHLGPTRDAGPTSADLFSAHRAKIRRHILHMVHDPVEADDLTQDVFLQAHRRLGSLRDPDAAVSWLYRIATHVCYDRFRKWSRQPRPRPLDVTRVAPTTSTSSDEDGSRLDRVIEQAEMSTCVRRYLEDLSDSYRNVILLHDLEGLTNPEIAQVLDVSVDVVKIRLHRARRKLQVALEANCDFSRDDRGVIVCEPTATSCGSSPSGTPAAGGTPATTSGAGQCAGHRISST